MQSSLVFPTVLQPVAAAVLPVLERGELSPHAAPRHTVCVQGEPMSLAYRVYYAPGTLRATIADSAGAPRAFALCPGCQHGDGYLREACLHELLRFRQPWVVPFVVQLLGEYVVEIVQVIAASLPSLDAGHVGEFVRANPAFMATIRRRAISYWSCQHRSRFPTLQAYPGLIALDALERAA